MEVVATAQEKIVRLFPEGAPGETVRMAEKISKEGNRVAEEKIKSPRSKHVWPPSEERRILRSTPSTAD